MFEKKKKDELVECGEIFMDLNEEQDKITDDLVR